MENNYNGSTYSAVSDFTSPPGLFPHDGDLTLAFLSGNGIGFFAPMDDLWYRATSQVTTINISSSQSESVYRSDEAASPIACLQQFQFCDASESRCGPLSSWLDAQTGAADMFGTTADFVMNNEIPSADNPTTSRYIWFVALLAMAVPQLNTVISQPGAKSLQSIEYLNAGYMGPLPDNQWQTDVTHWWATYLAGIQASVVSTSYGITDPSLQSVKFEPFNTWIQYHVCDNQVSRS